MGSWSLEQLLRHSCLSAEEEEPVVQKVLETNYVNESFGS